VLKPRSEASAIGIKLIETPEALWPILDSLGDQQSSSLLEKFIPGDVYHVDSVISERATVFSSVSRYGQPPMDVAQKGGIFTTYLLPGDSEEATALRTLNRELIQALGLVRGVSHAEFIRAHSDGDFYFLECAARVGGAYISEMVEIATGINLWREWARNRNRRRQGTLPAPCRARRLCRIDPDARPTGRSGHFGLQRPRNCLTPQATSSRWPRSASARSSANSKPAGRITAAVSLKNLWPSSLPARSQQPEVHLPRLRVP